MGLRWCKRSSGWSDVLLLLLFINTVSYLEKRCHDGNAFYAEKTKQQTKQRAKIIMNDSGQLEGILSILSHSNEVYSLL